MSFLPRDILVSYLFYARSDFSLLSQCIKLYPFTSLGLSLDVRASIVTQEEVVRLKVYCSKKVHVRIKQ